MTKRLNLNAYPGLTLEKYPWRLFQIEQIRKITEAHLPDPETYTLTLWAEVNRIRMMSPYLKTRRLKAVHAAINARATPKSLKPLVKTPRQWPLRAHMWSHTRPSAINWMKSWGDPDDHQLDCLRYRIVSKKK